MIAIPNMEKPKNCFQCSFNDGIYCCLIDTDTDALIPKMPTERLPLCPLIEIDLVRCGECKHCEKRETAKHILINYCEAHGISILDTDYCNWGERRADDNTIKADK